MLFYAADKVVVEMMIDVRKFQAVFKVKKLNVNNNKKNMVVVGRRQPESKTVQDVDNILIKHS